MPVTFNAKMTAGNSSDGDCQQVSAATTINSTGITVAAGTDRFLVAVLMWSSSATARSYTWNGVAMTEKAFSNVGGVGVAIAVLANPATGANTLQANWTGSSDCYMGAVCFDGAGAVVDADTKQETDASVTVTSDAAGVTVAAISTDNGDPTVSQTVIMINSPLGPGGAADYALGGSSNVHTFGNVGTTQAIVGIHINASGSGAAVPTIRRQTRRIADDVYDGGHFNECNIKTWF